MLGYGFRIHRASHFFFGISRLHLLAKLNIFYPSDVWQYVQAIYPSVARNSNPIQAPFKSIMKGAKDKKNIPKIFNNW